MKKWPKIQITINDIRKQSSLSLYEKYMQELQKAYLEAVKKLRELFNL